MWYKLAEGIKCRVQQGGHSCLAAGNLQEHASAPLTKSAEFPGYQQHKG